MSTSHRTPGRGNLPAADQPPRSPSGSQAQSVENIEADNDSLQSVAAGVPAEDVERPPREEDGPGSVESA